MREYSLDEVRRRARSGPALMLMRKLFSAGISFIGTITIARLLTPRDYGLAAMSIVMISFMQLFRDFGLTNALLRKGRIEEAEVTFLFWFNAAATAVIAALLAISAPAIADFYHEPIVAQIVRVSLIGFVVEGLSLQHAGLLKRDLRFGAVATAETVSVLMAFVVGLSVAVVRRDVWAIVAMGLTQSFVVSAITLYTAWWLPGPPRALPGGRELFRFGVNASVFSLLNFFSRNAGTFIIGHRLGSAPLGLFNRAFSLFQLPLNNLLQPLTSATLPVMARLRGEPRHYADVYCGLVRALSCALVPTGTVLVIVSSPMVMALLGERWSAAGPILSVLSAALILYGLVWPTSDLLISQNRSAELRTSGVCDFVLRVGGALVGSSFGLVGCAAGMTIGLILTVPFRVWQSGRIGPVGIAAQVAAFLPALPLGIGAGVGALGGRMLGEALGYGPGGVTLAALFAGGLGAMVPMIAVRSTRNAVMELLGSLSGRRALGLTTPAVAARSD